MPCATVPEHAAAAAQQYPGMPHASIRAYRARRYLSMLCAAVSGHFAHASIRACRARQYPSMLCAAVSGTRACCRAQQYPGMPHASIRACCTQQYPSVLHSHNLSWPLPSPCRLRANHHRVSEHAARNNIRACRARKYPSMLCAAVSEHAAHQNGCSASGRVLGPWAEFEGGFGWGGGPTHG